MLSETVALWPEPLGPRPSDRASCELGNQGRPDVWSTSAGRGHDAPSTTDLESLSRIYSQQQRRLAQHVQWHGWPSAWNTMTAAHR